MTIATTQKIIITVITLFFIMGCSFNYADAHLEDTLDEQMPDIVLIDAKLVFIRGTEVTIESDRIEIFSKQKQQSMFNVIFKEVSNNGEIRIEGNADQISIETESNNITMLGNIHARSNQDETELTSEYLYWNDEDRIITGSPILPVSIKKDIGSTISGYDFRGDAEKREITIGGNVQGQLVVDE